DAFHITGPHPEGRGLRRAIMLAIERAGTRPSDIAYINAHGTATRNNDEVESVLIADVFGPDVSFSSTKYYTGHTLGAAGAIEAAVCVKGILLGRFPGNPGVARTSGLAAVPRSSAIPYERGPVLSMSMAFGGTCLALLFDRLLDVPVPAAPHSRRPPVAIAAPELDKHVERTTMRITQVCKPACTADLICCATGIIGPFGVGNDALVRVLEKHISGIAGPSVSSGDFQIPRAIFSSPKLKSIHRRADTLSMAAFLAAEEAVESFSARGMGHRMDSWDSETALIVVTPLGAFHTTFRFLDGVLDFGESAPSPSFFSNSVHNAPAFYITAGLKMLGPSLTVNGFCHPFENALLLAESMLRNSQCPRVLLVAGEETCSLAPAICNLWNAHSCFKIGCCPGEGAAAFVLTLGPDETGTPMNSAVETESLQLSRRIFGNTFLNSAFARIIQMNR
ncbi:MAG: hypothetical protein JW808_04410, partial [Victivallales bacterium]|nr:hypothetical protein [Victivallales bacterium]